MDASNYKSDIHDSTSKEVYNTTGMGKLILLLLLCFEYMQTYKYIYSFIFIHKYYSIENSEDR
jgi:hypothetical protein